MNLNDNRHAKFIHLSNCITLRTYMANIVEIFEMASGMSWKLRRDSWIRNREEVELYLPKTSEMISMLLIAGQKRGNVLGPRHISLTLHR